jgi:hypothetical protein
MGDEKRPAEGVEQDEDVEAQLLRESLGAGLAVAAIFAGSTQAASYPVPSPPGTADAAAELALIPKKGEATRAIQGAKPKAQKAQKAKKKAVKAKKAKRTTATGAAAARRHQPQ